MNKLKEYKSQIITFVTIALLITYGIFPALTAANTLYNIIGSVGLLLLLVWGALELWSCFIPVEQQNHQSAETFKIETDTIKELQTIAGIKTHNKESAPFNPINNKLNENVIDELKDEFQNSKIKSDSDPLTDIPISRVSTEAKQRMAEIAKDDITKQLKKNAVKLESIFPESVEYSKSAPIKDISPLKNKPKTKRKPKTTK